MTVEATGAGQPAGPGAQEALLSVRDLRVRIAGKQGVAEVVNGLSYDVRAGETLAIVGESGSGKSISVLALLGLVPQPPARVSGEVHFGGQDLLTLDADRLRRVRGNDIAMVFQDPMTSLNPVLTIGRQLAEGMQAHLGLSEKDARARGVELLDLVGIPSARQRLDDYPHQFSGGMRQRVMIAIALACDPQVLIADEATTALDVTIQAQITELVAGLQRDLGMGVIWISHDLGVVAGIADRVLVMYAGRAVEEAVVDDLYVNPQHPYTRGLLGSIPVLGRPDDDLMSIPGRPPDPFHLPPGCAFWPRCAFRYDERCATESPPLRDIGAGHRVATFYDPDRPT
ncbi:MAG TPA: ABC transporter ATP-binding protein [Nocardioidaceae bacterium]|nr:ABC transporter ATP-binding protein [Nocardioidaceae bacterium]